MESLAPELFCVTIDKMAVSFKPVCYMNSLICFNGMVNRIHILKSKLTLAGHQHSPRHAERKYPYGCMVQPATSITNRVLQALGSLSDMANQDLQVAGTTFLSFYMNCFSHGRRHYDQQSSHPDDNMYPAVLSRAQHPRLLHSTLWHLLQLSG